MEKILIMNFKNECIGFVERCDDNTYIQVLNGVESRHNSLPPIMCDIVPEPTQFPAAIEVLEYYDLRDFDTWEYLKRSNGLKTSRDVWFLAEPPGQIWIPLIIGMQHYDSYARYMQVDDEVKLMISGRLYVKHHQIDVIPSCLTKYIKDTSNRFTNVKGYIKDLAEKASIKGIIGRIVLEFPS